MSCKHRNAHPTTFMWTYGFMWCHDCGAVRLVENKGYNTWVNSGTKGWLLPKGHKNVLRQIENGRG